MRTGIVFIMAASLYSAGCSPTQSSGAKRATDKNRELFHLKAKVVVAMEGGPLIIKAQLRYEGEQPITIYQLNNNVSLTELPQNWKAPPSEIIDGLIIFKAKPKVFIGCPYNYIKLHTGEELTETLPLYDLIPNIPKGIAELRLTWCIMDPGREQHHAQEQPHSIGHNWYAHRIIAEPSTLLRVDIPPSDATHLAGLQKQLEAWMVRPDFRDNDWKDLFYHLAGTKHPALVPVVCRMMSIGPGPQYVPDLLDLCYEMDEPPFGATDAYFVQLISSQLFEYAPQVFSRWRAKHVVLPTDAFQKLTRSNRIWTRLLTYVTFPHQCASDWKRALFTDLRSQTQPLPQSEFARLLHDLDADSFHVRELASANLEQFGERVESQLQQTLRTELAPEAKHRVRLILDRIGADKQSPEWKTILEHLSSGDCDRDAAVAILRALAKGNPSAELTKAAVATLNKLTTPN